MLEVIILFSSLISYKTLKILDLITTNLPVKTKLNQLTTNEDAIPKPVIKSNQIVSGKEQSRKPEDNDAKSVLLKK